DPSPAIARQVGRILDGEHPDMRRSDQFFTSGPVDHFHSQILNLLPDLDHSIQTNSYPVPV
ncbi:MAG: hypothetical protein AAFV07_21740, partial [Bacteroidota bacterium]